MREIKFRAWDTYNKEMIGRKGMTIHQLVEVYTKFDTNLVELMQYTGLKDKNGVEIYEGDILHRDNFTDWIVVWSGCSFQICNKTNQSQLYILSLSDGEEREVIGNIYENPELIK